MCVLFLNPLPHASFLSDSKRCFHFCCRSLTLSNFIVRPPYSPVPVGSNSHFATISTPDLFSLLQRKQLYPEYLLTSPFSPSSKEPQLQKICYEKNPLTIPQPFTIHPTHLIQPFTIQPPSNTHQKPIQNPSNHHPKPIQPPSNHHPTTIQRHPRLGKKLGTKWLPIPTSPASPRSGWRLPPVRLPLR